MQTLDMLYSLVPALGAILLSLYNWWVLRQGGKIKPLRVVNYGLWSVKVNERKVKNLFIPVILDNIAIKPALVTNIAIFFSSANGNKELPVTRRIELTMPGSMSGLNVNQFRINNTSEIVPFYPIPVNGLEGRMVMLDCHDGGEIIELDEELTCNIEVTYGSEKRSAISFPFRLSSENYEKALDHITWFRT